MLREKKQRIKNPSFKNKSRRPMRFIYWEQKSVVSRKKLSTLLKKLMSN